MNKMILTVAVAVLSAVSFSGFAAQTTNAQAKKDTTSEYQKFKKEAEAKIRDFDKDIAKLKAKTKHESKEIEAKYNKEVAVLEQKSRDLKKELEKEKQIDKAKFSAFKTDFEKSMDDLGKSIKDLFTSNSK